MDSDGADIGFGNLVQAIFEFIQSLTEKKKYKAMIRNVLADVVFYLITYLSIPEYQVYIIEKKLISRRMGGQPHAHLFLNFWPNGHRLKNRKNS